MYHYTRGLRHSRYLKIKGLDVKYIRQQFELFRENCDVVCVEQVIETVKGGTPLPEKALLLTFDDGYIDNYAFAFPLLEECEFMAPFYSGQDIHDASIA